MKTTLMLAMTAAALTFATTGAFAESSSRSKLSSGKSKMQEVNFEEMTMKGTIRNPEGTFLVQKKGLKFLPLYQVQKDMDAKIRESEPSEVLNQTGRTK